MNQPVFLCKERNSLAKILKSESECVHAHKCMHVTRREYHYRFKSKERVACCHDKGVRYALSILLCEAGYTLQPLQELVVTSLVQGRDVFVGLPLFSMACRCMHTLLHLIAFPNCCQLLQINVANADAKFTEATLFRSWHL